MPIRPTADRWDNWFPKLAIPTLAVFALIMVATNTSDIVDASKNRGLPGVYTSTSSDCNVRYGCSYSGKFVSDDGTVKLDDVFIDSENVKVGHSTTAQYIAGSRKKVYERDSHDWVAASLVAAGSALYLVGWGWLVARPWVRRRRI